MKKFIAYFKFKHTHIDRHYLMNTRGRTYESAISRDKSKAFRFATAEAALAAVTKKIDACDRGRANGYEYVPCVEEID